MLRASLIVSLLLTLGLASGCVVHARGGAGVHASSPDLVLVSPGVYVIADYHEPVFYSNGYYWLYRDGFWLRSSYYTGGWARVHTVPVGVRRIDRPRTYVRYRASGQVYRRDRSGRVIRHQGRPAARDHRGAPARRDHRATPARRDHRAPPARGPAARDHRATPSRAPAARDHRSPPPRDRRAKDKDKDKDRDRDRKKRR